jgi:tetratricopeptide (TPR) repeat protein
MLGLALDKPGATAQVSRLVDRYVETFGPNALRTLGAMLWLADRKLETGDIEGARTTLEEIVKRSSAESPRRAEALVGLSRIDRLEGNFEQACRHAAAAVAWYPDDVRRLGYRAQARKAWAQALIEAGRRKEALAQFQTARAELERAGVAWWQEREQLIEAAAMYDIPLEPFEDSRPPERSPAP